ncbi:MAG: o-succinylbenzoate synthase, partial [Haloferacaceae archaeon]
MTGPALREFSLDLATPLSTARGEVAERRGLLVGLDRDGTRGVGEATPLPGWTEPFDDCRAALETAGANGLPPAGRPAARHGVELARLDADARRRG